MKSNGFTLLELMVAMTILAILLSIAVPSFSNLISSNRIENQADNFLSSLAMARSEAIKLNQQVKLCKSSDGATCTTSGDWSVGWIIMDNSSNILQTYDGIPDGFTFSSTDLKDEVTFRPSGEITSTGGSIIICGPDGKEADAHVVFLSAVGRPRREHGATDCTAS